MVNGNICRPQGPGIRRQGSRPNAFGNETWCVRGAESLLDTFRVVWFSTVVIIIQGVSERNSSMRRVAAEVSG
jgi:hypothetical protein